MNFRLVSCLLFLLLPATYVVADSRINLSADIIVEENNNNLNAKINYFKNKGDNTKYIRITNKTVITPLMLTFPDIDFSIAAKNGHGTIASIGKNFVWVEPGSDVVLRINEGVKFYDFIPVVYMVGKKKPKVLTVVTGKEINAAKESIIITYKDSPEFIRITNNDVVNSVSNFDEVSKIKSGFSNLKVSRFTSINLDKEVYIISRNGMLGGSQYFTKNLIAYPNENIIIKATGVTHVKK
ncbi:hypothetical protein ABNF90_24575 [Raoultella ornithinolytica]|uniref:Uncharacterized protein n=1 Tax=Klebsiella grimontii TaxID=2058152 RepID=A0A285AV37_9ENTR|nr:hypothetical protein [Klebsiella grimontii]SNU32535.1 conserved exported hypothetical protein [Klebsiella grimontii]